jgi:hypothetical protein
MNDEWTSSSAFLKNAIKETKGDDAKQALFTSEAAPQTAEVQGSRAHGSSVGWVRRLRSQRDRKLFKG